MNGLPTTNREPHPYKTQESQSEKLLKSTKSVSSVIQMNTGAVRDLVWGETKSVPCITFRTYRTGEVFKRLGRLKEFDIN